VTFHFSGGVRTYSIVFLLAGPGRNPLLRRALEAPPKKLCASSEGGRRCTGRQGVVRRRRRAGARGFGQSSWPVSTRLIARATPGW
jgi:hypothetical protein